MSVEPRQATLLTPTLHELLDAPKQSAGRDQVQVEVGELEVGQLARRAPVSSRNITMAVSRRAAKSLPAQTTKPRQNWRLRGSRITLVAARDVCSFMTDPGTSCSPPIMNLLRQLQDAVIATELPLTAVLRRAMVFATELRSPLLQQWAQSELDGYPQGAALPPYRHRRQVSVRGNFLVEGTVLDRRWMWVPGSGPPPPPTDIAMPPPTPLNDVPITPYGVAAEDRSRLFNHSFLQPVAVYEDWLKTQTGDLRAHWPREALARYSDRLGAGSCLDAWQVLSRTDLIGVVDGVRTGLLRFVLELSEAAGAKDGSYAELAGPHGHISQLVQTTIYAGVFMEQPINVQGSTVGNLAGGRDNVVRQGDVSITQQGIDLDVLLGALRAAVEQLPAEKRDATQGLLEDLEEDAAAPQPARHRMLRKLKGIAAIAGAAGGAGTAVIDAVQAIQRALGN
jgi:hypothetical protein